MSIIKPKAVSKKQTLSVSIPTDVYEELGRYAEFIGETDKGHVVTEALRFVFRKDKGFHGNGPNPVAGA